MRIWDDMFPPGEVARMIAHPSRVDVSGGGDVADDGDDVGGGGGSDERQTSKRMSDVVFPNDDGGLRRMLVAVGPKGGWEEPYELDMFEQMGFQRVSLGSRVLRSDVAVVVSLLALANEACASNSTPSWPKISSPGKAEDDSAKSSEP